MRALFKKFKDGLIRQTPTFQRAFSGLFKGNQLDASAIEELEEILYTADFGHETVEDILEAIQKSYKKDASMRGEQAAQIGASVLQQVLAGSEASLGPPTDAPEVICLVGVNGSGKNHHRCQAST
jgi:fused signal recognition particle receptor